MTEVKREITKEEYDRAQEKNAYELISDTILMGYGAYGARVYVGEDGKYYLRYDMGGSCD